MKLSKIKKHILKLMEKMDGKNLKNIMVIKYICLMKKSN